MEGSADDLGAPDSWETADLEETMSRLLVSSNKTSASPSPPPELADEAPLSSVASSSEGISDDALSQVDLFLREALEKPRERLSVLRMEQDINKFIRDPTQQQLEFNSLPTSYLRLAAHRVAQHYFLQSTAIPDTNSLDGSGSRIVLHKSSSDCRFPLVRLADIPVNLPSEDSNTSVKVAIKQRPGKRSQATSKSSTHSSKTNFQKSVEERKEEYNRARARIFNSNMSGGSVANFKGEPSLPDSYQNCLVSPRHDGNNAVEGSENSLGRFLGDSSLGSNRLNSSGIDNEPDVSRYRVSSRVAIFRDREVDRKDPDYDRNYERYMQRFDPGFGFSRGSYTMQPLYAPAVNYNTEFPQLGTGHRPQISVNHQHRPLPQHMLPPWSPTAGPTAVGYCPPDAMIPQFSPNHVGAHVTSPIYMHSSQYPGPPQPRMAFVHPHEHIQSFAQQAHQQQPETSFGLARPR